MRWLSMMNKQRWTNVGLTIALMIVLIRVLGAALGWWNLFFVS